MAKDQIFESKNTNLRNQLKNYGNQLKGSIYKHMNKRITIPNKFLWGALLASYLTGAFIGKLVESDMHKRHHDHSIHQSEKVIERIVGDSILDKPIEEYSAEDFFTDKPICLYKIPEDFCLEQIRFLQSKRRDGVGLKNHLFVFEASEEIDEITEYVDFDNDLKIDEINKYYTNLKNLNSSKKVLGESKKKLEGYFNMTERYTNYWNGGFDKPIFPVQQKVFEGYLKQILEAKKCGGVANRGCLIERKSKILRPAAYEERKEEIFRPAAYEEKENLIK